MDRPDPNEPKYNKPGSVDLYRFDMDNYATTLEREIQRLRDENERRKKMSRSTTRLVAKYRKALELKEGSILRDTE